MKILIIVMLFFVQQLNIFACCGEDNRTLTEFLREERNKNIFSCRIISMKVDEYINSTMGGIQGTASAEIVYVYFGTIDTNIVTLKTGSYLEVNKTYIIYAYNKYGKAFSCGSPCPNRTHEIKNTINDNYELEILKQFSEIENTKMSGEFTFLSKNKKIMTKGEFKDGIPVNIWLHYNDNGVLKSERNLSTKVFKYYNDKGLLTYYEKKYNDSLINFKYSPKTNFPSEHKWVKIPGSECWITESYDYYSNGNLKHYQSNIYKETRRGINQSYYKNGKYLEGYENGKIKVKGQLLDDKPVGLWKWYNEKGHRVKKFDYKDGTITQENTEKLIN